ncbi:hypothetical protein HDU97_006242 [Phlyctochytrium planicorne]|nr:hypothetical protein HDU97_006242 [Phlyctochytrium planicorne]
MKFLRPVAMMAAVLATCTSIASAHPQLGEAGHELVRRQVIVRPTTTAVPTSVPPQPTTTVPPQPTTTQIPTSNPPTTVPTKSTPPPDPNTGTIITPDPKTTDTPSPNPDPNSSANPTTSNPTTSDSSANPSGTSSNSTKSGNDGQLSTQYIIIMCIVIVSVIGIAVAVYIFRKWLLPTSKDFKKRRLGLGGTTERRGSGAPGRHDEDEWAPPSTMGSSEVGTAAGTGSVLMGGRSTPDRANIREHLNASTPLPEVPIALQQPTLPDVGFDAPMQQQPPMGYDPRYNPYAVHNPYMQAQPQGQQWGQMPHQGVPTTAGGYPMQQPPWVQAGHPHQ